MTTVNGVKTLAMIKMEKNLIAVIDKGYTRYPYKDYSVNEMLNWFLREVQELVNAIDGETNTNIKNEIGDCSNVLDYMYEVVSARGENDV